ncbi:MAG: TCP-1/cpn60 chaperonin family protein [Methanomassiliicoccales archaeon]|nr:MAG: TCP-1/cpn60 chaperonin family protein [Methanomassiliicoccales archaeon]
MGTNTGPILILKEGTRREKGKDAQYNNIMVARTIADTLKTTLGPRGMDKMLVTPIGDVTITNDGVTILKDIEVQHPVAKMLVEVAKTLDQECGDGTTTAVLLTGELLKKAQELIDADVHPTVIARGFSMASSKALEVLEDIARPIDPDDRKELLDIARTSMMSKAIVGVRDHLATIAVDAVKAVTERRDGRTVVDLDNINIVKKQGGSVEDTMLIKGMVVDKGPEHVIMPKRVENASIALITTALEVKKTEVEAKIEITDPSQMHAFLEEEEREQRELVNAILKAGANVVICQKGIGDEAKHVLSKAGVFALQKVKESDMEKLSRACGANLVGDPRHIEPADLGHASLVEAKKLEGDEMTFITGCRNPRSVTILIRGGTEHVVSETERSLDDALNVVRVATEDGKMITGAGAAAMEISMRLKEYASKVSGREQLVINAFAASLESIPATLAENAGLDKVDILIQLRQAHANGMVDAGVNVFDGKVEDMRKKYVLEPIRVGRQVISSAADAATMIIRIDDVIASKGAEPSPPSKGED